MNIVSKFLILVLLVYFILPIMANPNDQSTNNPRDCVHIPGKLDELFKRGEDFYVDGKFDAAYRCFQSFIYDSKSSSDKDKMDNLRRAYIFKGAIETLKGNFPESIKSYQNALEVMFSSPLNYKEKQSPDIQQDFAKIYNNIYISASHDKQEVLALEYKKKHDALRTLNEKSGTVLAKDPFERGSIYFGEGVFHMEKGLRLRESKNKEEEMIFELALAISNLENAEKEYLKSENGTYKSVMRISTLLHESVSHEVSGKPEEAKKKFDAAIEERDNSKVDPKYLEMMSQAMTKIVEVKREINKKEPGKYKDEEIQKESNYARKIQETINPSLKDCNNLPEGIWNLQLAQNYYGEANDSYNKRKFDKVIFYANCAERLLPVQHSGNKIQDLNAKKLLIKIFALQKDYFKEVRDNKKVSTRLNSILDLIREYYLYTNTIGIDKENEIKREQYRDFFEESFLIFKNNKDYKNAFKAAEKFRSITISEYINLHNALSSFGISPEDKKRLVNLKKEMNQLAAKSIAYQFMNIDITEITRKNNSLITEFEKLDTKLKKGNSDYRQLRSSSALNFSEDELIQKLNGANKVMLHFFFSDVEKNKGNLFVSILGGNPKKCPSGFCNYHYTGILESELNEKILFFKLLLSINPKRYNESSKNIFVVVNQGIVEAYNDREKYIQSFQYLGDAKSDKLKAHLCPNQKNTTECSVYIIPKDKFFVWMDELSKELHKLLIQPLYKNELIHPGSDKEIGDQLVISPDKVLYFLPFSALKDENGKYFLESHAHSLTPSADAWFYNHNKYTNADKPNIDALLVGAPTLLETKPRYCDPKTNTEISDALKAMSCVMTENVFDHFNEIDWIQKSFSQFKKGIIEIKNLLPKKFSEEEVYLLTGKEATKKRLQEILNSQEDTFIRYLHFVGHGYSNPDNPGLNSILLSPELSSDSKTNSLGETERSLSRFLTEADVMGMNFTSELVTLSSCSSASGFESEAEGNIGLPRAFILSGARNVLGPLWNVNSTKTKEILVDFYKNINQSRAEDTPELKKSENEGIILRETLLQFRKKHSDHQIPYYWAAFVIYGE